MNKNNRYIFNWLFVVLLMQTMVSCQKVIDLNLNASNPQLIVQGEISDQPVPAIVKLNLTVNFDEKNSFPPATGALVVLSDNVGNSATLTETSPGVYTSSAITGVPGRSYALSISYKGKAYSSFSTMNSPGKITLIYPETNFLSGDLSLIVYFKDQPGIENYYRMIETINGKKDKFIYSIDDGLLDGENISFFFFGAEKGLVSGDTVLVDLQTIDRGVYDYLRTLNEQAGGGGGGSTAPANPKSNITNGALGFFNAYSLDRDTIVIP